MNGEKLLRRDLAPGTVFQYRGTLDKYRYWYVPRAGEWKVPEAIFKKFDLVNISDNPDFGVEVEVFSLPPSEPEYNEYGEVAP